MSEQETRECQYEECGAPFTPRKPWQEYCCKEHRRAQWEIEHERKTIARYMARIGRRGGHAKAEKMRRMGRGDDENKTD